MLPLPGGRLRFDDRSLISGVLGRLHVNPFRVDALGVADFASLRAMAAGEAAGECTTPKPAFSKVADDKDKRAAAGVLLALVLRSAPPADEAASAILPFVPGQTCWQRT